MTDETLTEDYGTACFIPEATPRPWYVAGYALAAVERVMLADYGAERQYGRTHLRFRLPNGEIEFIGSADKLRGRSKRGGTMFVLQSVAPELSPSAGRLGAIMETASSRGIVLRPLPTRNGEGQ